MADGFFPKVPGATRDPAACARARRNAAAMATRQFDANRRKVSQLELTADTQIDGSQGVLLVDPDAFTRTLDLPDAADMEEGAVITIKNTNTANTFNIDTPSNDSFDGFSPLSMSAFAVVTLIAATSSTGSRGWYIIGN